MLPNDLISQVLELRDQGLTDTVIMQELSKNGYSSDQITDAIFQADATLSPSFPSSASPPPRSTSSAPYPEGNIYERIEEITENMIDEKWDELIAEVKKIVEWKERLEEKQLKIQTDLDKVKEDFKLLHQGVLGKLEEYDTRMRDVGTELKAVGKVFKEVIPEFVEGVKELQGMIPKK